MFNLTNNSNSLMNYFSKGYSIKAIIGASSTNPFTNSNMAFVTDQSTTRLVGVCNNI